MAASWTGRTTSTTSSVRVTTVGTVAGSSRQCHRHQFVRRIERTFRGWTEDGLVVLGVDFTAVDGSTAAALEDLADVVARVAVTSSGDCPQ